MKYTTYMGTRTKIRISVLLFLLTGMMICSCTAVETDSASIEQGQQMAEQKQEDDPSKTHEIPADIILEEQNVLEQSTALEEDISTQKEASEKETVEEGRPKVKGIFVTGAMAGTANMSNLIDLVDRTELNALVIDIKNDEGRVTYDMQVPLVQEMGACRKYIGDIEELVAECKEKDIYLIARVVAFKDPFLAEVKSEWCIHNSDGSLFKDKDGLSWLNPYNREVWNYLVTVAEGALEIGFDEIQFDYVRFSTDSGMKNADFGETAQNKDRQQIITEFVKYVSEKIHEAGGAVSADVYGVVIDSELDQQIVGQNYVELSKYLDYISPMVYPSHYGPYNYDIPVPDAEPYRLVLAAMQSSRKVLAGISDNTISENNISYSVEELAVLPPMEGVKAQVRPWLQDFTAAWVKGHISYGAEEIRAQIQAIYDAGYEEWILWNAANHYTEEGLLAAGEEE